MVAMQDSGAMCDYLSLFVHGFTETHLDALCHLPAPKARTRGTASGSTSYDMPVDHTGTIDFWRDGIVTRGVLYDIPRLRGTECVDARRAGARLGARRRRRRAGRDAAAPATRCSSAAASRPYFDAATGERPGFGAPAGCTRRASSSSPSTEASMLVWDMQDAPIADQGIPNPRPASRCRCTCTTSCSRTWACRSSTTPTSSRWRPRARTIGRWEFQFVVAPLVIPRRTGSPVNPLAIL